MRGKKNIFADIIFRWLGFVSLPVFSMMRPNLFYILAYHRVSPFNIGNYPFEAGTISAIPEEFLTLDKVKIFNAPQMEISSSFIRESIRNKRNISAYMPRESWEYLDEMNFYRK